MSIRRLVALSCLVALLGALPRIPGAAAGSHAVRDDGELPAPRVDCTSCLIVDEEGSALWARAAGRTRPVASTTKMITALVTVAEADLDAEVEVSERAAAVPGGRFSLHAGETFTVRELLFALLVGSSNDAAVALAEHVAGTEEEFVRRMNSRARELGATRSHFTTPHGLDDAGHLATAFDLALIGAALLEDPLLAEIVSTPRASVSSARRTDVLENTNELLERYEGLLGIKTGYTSGAGNVLVAAAERQGRRLITVAMDSTNAFKDSRRLLNHGFRILSAAVLVDEGEPLGSIVFDPGGTLQVAAADAIRGLPLRDNVKLELRLGGDLRAPIDPGQTVGSVVITMGGQVIGRTEAVAVARLTAAPPGWPERSLAFVIRMAARVLPGGAG